MAYVATPPKYIEPPNPFMEMSGVMRQVRENETARSYQQRQQAASAYDDLRIAQNKEEYEQQQQIRATKKVQMSNGLRALSQTFDAALQSGDNVSAYESYLTMRTMVGMDPVERLNPQTAQLALGAREVATQNPQFLALFEGVRQGMEATVVTINKRAMPLTKAVKLASTDQTVMNVLTDGMPPLQRNQLSQLIPGSYYDEDTETVFTGNNAKALESFKQQFPGASGREFMQYKQNVAATVNKELELQAFGVEHGLTASKNAPTDMLALNIVADVAGGREEDSFDIRGLGGEKATVKDVYAVARGLLDPTSGGFSSEDVRYAFQTSAADNTLDTQEIRRNAGIHKNFRRVMGDQAVNLPEEITASPDNLMAFNAGMGNQPISEVTEGGKAVTRYGALFSIVDPVTGGIRDEAKAILEANVTPEARASRMRSYVREVAPSVTVQNEILNGISGYDSPVPEVLRKVPLRDKATWGSIGNLYAQNPEAFAKNPGYVESMVESSRLANERSADAEIAGASLVYNNREASEALASLLQRAPKPVVGKVKETSSMRTVPPGTTTVTTEGGDGLEDFGAGGGGQTRETIKEGGTTRSSGSQVELGEQITNLEQIRAYFAGNAQDGGNLSPEMLVLSQQVIPKMISDNPEQAYDKFNAYLTTLQKEYAVDPTTAQVFSQVGRQLLSAQMEQRFKLDSAEQVQGLKDATEKTPYVDKTALADGRVVSRRGVYDPATKTIDFGDGTPPMPLQQAVERANRATNNMPDQDLKKLQAEKQYWANAKEFREQYDIPDTLENADIAEFSTQMKALLAAKPDSKPNVDATVEAVKLMAPKSNIGIANYFLAGPERSYIDAFSGRVAKKPYTTGDGPGSTDVQIGQAVFKEMAVSIGETLRTQKQNLDQHEKAILEVMQRTCDRLQTETRVSVIYDAIYDIRRYVLADATESEKQRMSTWAISSTGVGLQKGRQDTREPNQFITGDPSDFYSELEKKTNKSFVNPLDLVVTIDKFGKASPRGDFVFPIGQGGEKGAFSTIQRDIESVNGLSMGRMESYPVSDDSQKGRTYRYPFSDDIASRLPDTEVTYNGTKLQVLQLPH